MRRAFVRPNMPLEKSLQHAASLPNIWFRIDYLLWNFGSQRYIYYLYIMRINVSVGVQLYALGQHNKREGGTGLLYYSAIALIG